MQKEFELSDGQKGLWHIQKLNIKSTAYNSYFSAQIDSEIEIEDLRKVCNYISQKHPILNARFLEKDGDLKQLVDSENKIPFIVLNLSDKNEVNKTLNNELNKPIDLENGPLSCFIVAITRDNQKYILLKSHHIVLDYYSLGVILKEIAFFYKKVINNEEVVIEQDNVPFFEHIQAIREYEVTEKYNNSLEYWNLKLKNMPQKLRLPYGNTRNVNINNKASNIILNLDKETTERIYNKASEVGVTPFSFLLANYHIALSYYFADNNISTGVPFLGRFSKEHLNTIGYYVNTLPVNIQVDDELPFADYVKQIHKEVRKMLGNQKVSSQKIKEKLNVSADNSSKVMYQTMFVLEKARDKDLQGSALYFLGVDGVDLEVDGLKLKSYTLKGKYAQDDIVVILEKYKDNILGAVQYNNELFDEKFINSFVEFYKNILKITAQNSDKYIYELKQPIVSENQIIECINNAALNKANNYYNKGGIVHFLEKTFREFADKTAIEYGNDKITYKQLDMKSIVVGHAIQSTNYKPKGRVIIYCDNKLHTIYGIVATIRIGSSYIVIEKDTPIHRIKEIIEQVSPNTILIDEKSRGKVEEIVVNQDIAIINIEHCKESDEGDIKRVDIDDKDEAYCIFTSGSSGKPKGISVPNDGILRLVLNSNYCKLTEKNIIAQISNFAFDASTFEIWGTFLNGATMVMIDKEKVLSMEIFGETIENKHVDTMFMTTSLLNQLSTMENIKFRGLKKILFGGEKANLSCVKNFLNKLPNCEFIHVYGPSEDTTFTTHYNITKDLLEQNSFEQNLPIGTPITDTTVNIMDTTGRYNLPIGVVGEIYIGGAGLAKGYIGQKEETDKKFIVVKDYKSETKRFYKSGDLGFRNNNGEIVFFGRKDLQVKIRGFRIELSEIKKKIDNMDIVEDSYVTVMENSSSQKQIAAYIKLANIEEFDVSKVKAYLRELLPEYMIPTYIIKMDKFQLNDNGKIDKNRLPKVDMEIEQFEYVQPANDIENEIEGIWCEVLNLKKVSCTADFFDVGGHSLLTIKLKMLIEKRYSINIDIEDIFKLTTIRAQALYVDKRIKKQKCGNVTIPKIKRIERREMEAD